METLRYNKRLSKLSWSSRVEGLNVVLLRFLFLPLLVVQAHTNFIFNQFNASTLKLYGNDSTQSNALSLNGRFQFRLRRAAYLHAMRMKYQNSTFSFSTNFVFSIVPSPASQSAFGLAFMITPNSSLFPSVKLALISNLSVLGEASNHLFAVVFDASKNVDNNHVGVDLNDLRSVNSTPAGYWINSTRFADLDLKSGRNIQVWIDYDSLHKELKVTITEAALDRRQKPLLHMKNMSLSNILEEDMYIGFSAATESIYEEDYILSWSFTTNGISPSLNTSSFPSFSHRKSKSSNSKLMSSIITLCVLVILLVVAGCLVQSKINRYRDMIEEWEVEYWAHRFNYKDLFTATKGFREEEILGSGGFGRVYRGVLPSSGIQVAVKCIRRQTDDGMKEFIAEISSLGRLQHRNLVQIKGFCRRKKELFIVYDYMSNGSLDKMIFGNPKKIFHWDQRYKIIRDVPAGLLYLHEEWEKCVVHRDIKSSNVLLDSELNGKLGDFGLARLYEHNENSQTTRVVGTLGYIAPELVHTGKASPATDVFSFDVFMLEVACRRRSFDPSLQPGQTVMVDWVRDLHAKSSLMDAANPSLGGQYVEGEMERVLKLGLICSNRQVEGRLGMRQVVQMLAEEAPIPGIYGLFNLELSSPRSATESVQDYSHSSDASISESLDAR